MNVIHKLLQINVSLYCLLVIHDLHGGERKLHREADGVRVLQRYRDIVEVQTHSGQYKIAGETNQHITRGY